MRSWDSLTALGCYLGLADAGILADRAAGCPGADDMLTAIDAAASFLSEKFSPGVAGDLPYALASTDFTGLAAREGDRILLLTGDLYRRMAMPPYGRNDLPRPDFFDRQAREYLRRLSASLRAALYRTGIRTEIVSLENPAARESVEELRRLPCRVYGGEEPGGPQGHFSVALAPYLQFLLDRHEACIGPAGSAAILEIVDHLSACPGYYRQASRELKAETAQTLSSAITALRKAGDNNPERADLMAALGLLLFNVYPSPAIVKFLAIHRPGGGNRFLEYEHNALLAMSLLCMGKRAAATGYCQRAYDAAPEADLKAYARVLEGCIALEEHDYRNAAAALERARDAAGRPGLRSMAGFYLGIVRYEAGDTGLALDCFRDARIGAEDNVDAMAACNNIGTCYMVQGDLPNALRTLEEADTLGTCTNQAPVKLNRSVASGNAGIVYLSMREPRLAQEQFRKAMKVARETGNARGVADQLMNIGLAQKAMGDYAIACHHFVAGMNYACTIDYLEGVLYARDQIGQVLALQGKHDEEENVFQDIARRHPGIRKLLSRR